MEIQSSWEDEETKVRSSPRRTRIPCFLCLCILVFLASMRLGALGHLNGALASANGAMASGKILFKRHIFKNDDDDGTTGDTEQDGPRKASAVDPFPPNFESKLYLSRYRQHVPRGTMLDEAHYKAVGRDKGWICTRGQELRGFINTEIAAKLPGNVLELGPFMNPTLFGPNIKYFDVLDMKGLKERAKAIKYPIVREVEIDCKCSCCNVVSSLVFVRCSMHHSHVSIFQTSTQMPT
jgi:hypothetical protein